MKCTEVIEWMHRYLDHDLSIDEITEMFNHIDNCLPCAEIFDRLTTLSQQLEQLPDVKAPFSLVDSILPRLDEIDRGLLESGKTGTEDQVVVPFSREASQGKRQEGSSIGRRTGIGAVAAALILGIAIFNMPKEIPGAQVDTQLNESAKTMDANAGAAKMNKDTADTGNGRADSDAAPNSSANDSNMFQAVIAETPNPEMAAQDAADPPEGGTEPSVPAAGSTSAGEPSNAVSSQKPAHEVTATPNTSGDRSSTLAAPDKASASGDTSDNKLNSDIMESMKIPQSNKDQGIMSLLPPSNATGELSWTSSDGQYAAVVEGKQLVIYSIPPTGIGINRLPLTSLPLAGKWVTGEWAADSLEFRYVTNDNGTAVENVYVIPDMGTSTPLPKGSPSVTPTHSVENDPPSTSSTK